MMMDEMIFGLSMTDYYEQIKSGNFEEANKIKTAVFKAEA